MRKAFHIARDLLFALAISFVRRRAAFLSSRKSLSWVTFFFFRRVNAHSILTRNNADRYPFIYGDH